MQRILSTYLFVQRTLTPELLGQVSAAGFAGVEVFCSRGHFDYASPEAVRELERALADRNLFLHALHSPTSRDRGPGGEGGAPLSICEVERVRRIAAMDEIKRALDVAELVPFRYFVQHMGGKHEEPDPRKLDAAFSTLEHLALHARRAGATIALENTLSEMGSPAQLRSFVDETRLTGLKFCFDAGHANLADGPAEGKLERCFGPMRELVVTAHIHDNHGETDEHLVPYEGKLDWAAAARLFSAAPEKELPLVLELKEPLSAPGAEARAAAGLLEAARKALDKFEKEIKRAG